MPVSFRASALRTLSARVLAAGLALSLGAALAAGPATAQSGLAGPYLAARAASGSSDYEAAATYFTRALTRDPRNPLLLESALLAQVALGEIDRALPIAEAMRGVAGTSQVAGLVRLAAAVRAGRFDEALAELDAGGAGTGPLVEGLTRAWLHLGQGRMSDATATFDRVATVEGLESLALYHKALALASVGDFEGADAIFSGATGAPLRATRRGVIAHAEVLSQLERDPAAVELIDKAFGDEMDPGLSALRERLAAGETVPFDLVTGAADGIAEVFYTVASLLGNETSDVYTLAYARIAVHLRPGHVDALLLAAALLEAQGQHELAIRAYGGVPPTDPGYHIAEMGRADALVASDRLDAAIEVLQQLSRLRPEIPGVWATLGDTLRRADRYDDATRAYDAAIALFDTAEPSQWPIYYARGICHERQKRWEAAEADFRKALALVPDQPQVLNYLGYSFLELNRNLDEALSMIERAVAARPDDGYIVDSLGWALYRLGRYDEAVRPMERAVELTPVDSIVNDHLGDVYWAVGRRREAEFQWKRALSFKPETEAEAARIRRKLAVGLDAVLAEEGAPPLAVVTRNGN